MSFFNARISTVQFYVPRSVLELLDRDAVADRARERGLEKTSFEYSTKSVPPTQARITCQVGVAVCIVDELTALAERSTGPIVVDIAEAVKAGLDALERAK